MAIAACRTSVWIIPKNEASASVEIWADDQSGIGMDSKSLVSFFFFFLLLAFVVFIYLLFYFLINLF